MTSPEWEAANEDDSDRFPQTSHASAPESTESHELGSRVVPDPARVAQWEFLVQNTASWWPRQKAEAAMRLADEEHAALVAEVERLRGEVARMRLERDCSDAALVVLKGDADSLGDALTEEVLRAEAAEAEVERLRGRLDISERSVAEARGDNPSGFMSQREWEDWSNELAMILPEDAECWPGVNPEGAQESIIANALRYLVAAEAKVEALWSDADVTWRCSACGWVASDETIGSALWREAERTVSMVCPECTAEGSFVDHEPLVETVSALVHSAWMDTKREQGVTSRPSEWGEEQMVPYTDLSERAKDLDRGTVRAVLDALRRAVLADAPAEQRALNCPVCGNGEEGDCICEAAEAIAKAKWEADGLAVREGPWSAVGIIKRRSLIIKALPEAAEQRAEGGA